MDQPSHQELVTSNLQKLTSNPVHLLPKPVMWFHISWWDLIIVPLIMVMLRFILKSFHCNIILDLFRIQTPLQSNQLMMMKWTISCNSFYQNTMVIFWMLTSRLFSFDNIDYLQIKIVRVDPQRNRNIVAPTLCALSKQNILLIIHHRFGHVYIYRLKLMARKVIMEGPPKHFPGLEEPWPICILTKATKIPRFPIIYV